MITKSLDQIDESDLQNLIENEVIEKKTIEYKQELPGDSPSEKKEFLADVSSFTNASGGDIVYGIIEDRGTGIPQKLEGLNIENVDQEILKLDSRIRDGIEPRIIGIAIQPVKLSNSNTVLIIRIPKSWRSPHRVKFQGHNKFYGRSTNGKYELDVEELRVAFNLSETIAERIRKFREDRISKIYADETPVLFRSKAKVILHIIPVISFNPTQYYNITSLTSYPRKINLAPIYCSGWNDRYNYDGFLTYHEGRDGESRSYVQLFKNGIIEAVEGLLLEPQEEKLFIPNIAFEKELIITLSDYLFTLKKMNVDLPILIFLTLIGVKGYSMPFSQRYGRGNMIDRDILLLLEVVVENYSSVEDRNYIAKNILRPIFDSI